MRFAAIILFWIASFSSALGAWKYDWSVRTDQAGKPAGHFDTTPYPITESSTSYSITNDDGVKTFTLGTLYFCDGAAVVNGDGTSLATPFNTISNALKAMPTNGNYTLVVRGAHDAFDGVYRPWVTSGNIEHIGTGTDDSHRWMMVGYGQERPTIKGFTNNAISIDLIAADRSRSNQFATVQRFGMTENMRGGIDITWWVSGGTNHPVGYFNCIDLYITNICTSLATNIVSGGVTNANFRYGAAGIYYSKATNNWVYHCTVAHTLEHGIKVGDGTTNTIVEWCLVKECGYWPGIETNLFNFDDNVTPPSYITNWVAQVHQQSAAIDFPNDGDSGWNTTCRYNIVSYGLCQGIQIRNSQHVYCYGNEVFNCPNLSTNVNPTLAGMSLAYPPQSQILVLAVGSRPYRLSDINIYNNLVHDNLNTDIESCGIGVEPSFEIGNGILIYNNVLYNNSRAGIMFHPNFTALTNRYIGIYNNTIVQHTNNAAIFEYGSSTYPINTNELTMWNNIIMNDGGGACVGFTSTKLLPNTNYDFNCFYYPAGGSRGTLVAPNDVASGASTYPSLNATNYSPLANSPAISSGTNLIALFTNDFNFTNRSATLAWDMGAIAYVNADAGPPPNPTNGTSTTSISLIAKRIDTATSTFYVTNIGGANLLGTASVATAYFTLSGSGTNYILAPATSTNITVSFGPRAQGIYSDVVTLTGGGGASIALTGNSTNFPTASLVGKVSTTGKVSIR